MDNGHIYLNDLLNIKPEEFENTKIRFVQSNGIDEPMDKYIENPNEVNEKWFFNRTSQRYFKVGQIAICLLKLSANEWLLTTIKRITKDLDVKDGVNYEGEEVPEYKKYFGRVVIKYHKKGQSQGYKFKTICDELEVLEILSARYDGEEFPGYDNVRLSYTELKTIINGAKRSWAAALKNQKAVYLITDKNNGKLYVGSATSENGMLWSRWESYVNNGHGGNVELKKLIDEIDFEYIKRNFQYSILENYNSKVDDDIIIKRESWWKETLQSRDGKGYNKN